ncbi:hypothetical protein [Asanoa iriomotensis]|uniref:Uncharacterized protein n=1 Tax=Asanoa iriomotensis TaxID=234613 RepID=A0ABQ4CAE0_9ACTN|nr:hypothetical protein [Asanoa iriomotensis]GIF59747.1 hypothetical protein Air01nite_58420 [Asanoa iriomotensis]
MRRLRVALSVFAAATLGAVLSLAGASPAQAKPNICPITFGGSAGSHICAYIPTRAPAVLDNMFLVGGDHRVYANIQVSYNSYTGWFPVGDANSRAYSHVWFSGTGDVQTARVIGSDGRAWSVDIDMRDGEVLGLGTWANPSAVPHSTVTIRGDSSGWRMTPYVTTSQYFPSGQIDYYVVGASFHVYRKACNTTCGGWQDLGGVARSMVFPIWTNSTQGKIGVIGTDGRTYTKIYNKTTGAGSWVLDNAIIL